MREHWEFFVGALALAAGLWNQIKQFLSWIESWVISTRRLDFETAALLLSFLEQRRKGSSREPAYGSSKGIFVRPLRRTARVVYRMLIWSGPQIFWWERRPIRFHRLKDDVDSNGGTEQVFKFIRGTVDWEALLLTAADWENSKKEVPRGRHRVKYYYGKSFGAELAESAQKGRRSSENDDDFTPSSARQYLRWRLDDLGGPESPNGLHDLALSDELLAVTAEIEHWHESREWYADHKIPWRRGYIYHGAPGTGKTSLARAIAETLDLPVHVFDLASMSNEELRRSWTSMAADMPCMALIEDIDGVFQGRENVRQGGSMSSSLTFDCLLNCIDGIERSSGVLLIMTTNDKSSIDPALFDRPGRIDRVVEFKGLDHMGRLKLARQVLGEGPEAERIARENDGISAAKLQELCCRSAIAKRFAHRNDDDPEPPFSGELRIGIIRK